MTGKAILALSPSQLSDWLANEEQYFIKKMLGQRMAQTKPMAVGSAFDCYVKAEILGGGREYFQTAFVKSVEPELREQAFTDGATVFLDYKLSGAFDALMEHIKKPVCEERVIGEIEGVPINCVVDLVDEGFILDWKVNGFYSSGRLVRGGKVWRDGNVTLPDPYERCLIESSPWQNQLETYALLHGREDAWVDQICYPGPRVAQLRYKITDCAKLKAAYKALWAKVTRWNETGQFLDDWDRQRMLELVSRG